MAQTIDLPLVDDGEAFGISSLQDITIDLPFIDGGTVFGVEVVPLSAASVDLTVNGTEFPNTMARTFRDQLADVGSFSFAVHEDDLGSLAFDDFVVFQRAGTPAFAGVVEGMRRVALGSGEAGGKIVNISGRGSLAEWERAPVFPSRGVGELPIELVRSFSWPSPDFDFSDWPLAKLVNRQREYADWRSPLPWIWPDTTGYWIWANVPGVSATEAPAGTCLFRKTFTLDEDAFVRIYFGSDNAGGVLYVDGAEVSTGAGFEVGEYVTMELSEGDHYLAASVTNRARISAGPNPGGMICAVYTVGDGGLLDELVTHSDATWRCLPYPTTLPGFTHGQVLRILLEEAQAADCLDGWSLDFTDTLDSDGVAWSSYREITVQTRRPAIDVLREMSDAFIDVAAAPGARVLRAWNHGGRGSTVGVTLQATTDPATSDFLALQHDGRRVRMNAALVRYADGDLEVRDETSISAYDGRYEYLELGSIKGTAEATRIAEALIANRSEPSWSTTGELAPHNGAATPYEGGWAVADTITCPDESEDDVPMRVRSLNMRENDVGRVTWGFEFRDQRYEVEEVHDAWLRRMAAGSGLAGARVASRAGQPPPTARAITELQVARFSYDTSDLVESESQNDPAAVSGNIVELFGELKVAGSTTTTVIVKIRRDGDWSTIGTLTFTAGVTETETAVAVEPVKANLDKLQAEITAAGAGAQGLVVQVRAI